jgi:hypothetical protein
MPRVRTPPSLTAYGRRRVSPRNLEQTQQRACQSDNRLGALPAGWLATEMNLRVASSVYSVGGYLAQRVSGPL